VAVLGINRHRIWRAMQEFLTMPAKGLVRHLRGRACPP
jgi:hypothetical protein